MPILQLVRFRVETKIDAGAWATNAALDAKTLELRKAGATDPVVVPDDDVVMIVFVIESEDDLEAATETARKIISKALNGHDEFTIGHERETESL